MKRIFVLVLLSFSLINLAFAQQMSVIDPELYTLMNSKSGGKISVNIILKENIDASKMNVRKSFSSRDAQRTYMVEEMKKQAEKSQADVLKTLKANERSIQVTDIKCYWITNMITCNATPDAILKIAEHPDVEAVFYNKKQKLIYEDATQSEVVDKAVASEEIYNGTNVEKVNAHKVWDLGFRGEDIIVAVIDSGVNTEHIDLQDHLWDDGNENHGYNTLESNYDISDGSGHGTHCAGTVCGDGTSGTITGMAPDATLMVVKVLDENGAGTPESVIAGVQYAVENGAHVMSLSIGFTYANTPTREAFREVFANALKAGVVAAVAAGNDGDDLDEYPTPNNINAPGDCPPPYLSQDKQSDNDAPTSVISVGAVNYDDEPCEFSSEGPVTWQGSKFADYPLGSAYSTENIKYDNGEYSHSLANTEASKFAVMFPSSMLTQFVNGGTLKSVSIYAGTSGWGGLYIYKGGETPESGIKLYEGSYNYSQTGSMMDLVLKNNVQIDVNENLWIVFDEWMTGNIIPLATNTDNSNGRWIYSKSYGKWTNSQVSNMIMVRANISTSNDTEEKIGLIRPDVCAPGNLVQSTSADYPSFYYSYMSGTSQATPCVAGTIALLLDANPDLTPADICRVLEETAVKVGGATTKSNKTGSGRIDAYNAVLAVATNLQLTAPTLTATAKSSSQIDLSWTIAPGADSYTVYRDGSVVTSVTTTSYSDKGLNPETAYRYEIEAIRGSESVISDAVSATTKAESAAYRIKVSTSTHEHYGKYLNISSNELPANSGNNTNVNVSTYAESNNQIFTLEDAGNGNYYLCGADGYYIKCGTNNLGKAWNVYAYSTTEKTPIWFNYVDANNFYLRDYDKSGDNYFKVENGKIFCNAPSSNTDVVTWTLEAVGSSTPTAPATPTGLVATAKGETSIGLTWNAVIGATSYNVYRNDSEIATGLTGTSYTDNNGLTAETNYCYTVTAVNANGESAKSTQACAKTLAAGSAVEQEVTIGGEIGSNNYAIPIEPYYNYTFSQQIYTQSEIGTGVGIISKIAFKQKNTASPSGRKIKVYMQNVSKSSFEGYYDWVAVTDNSDKVFEGDITLPGDGQDFEIILSNSFEYTGENLLISVCDYTGSYTSSSVTFYTYQTADVRSLVVRSLNTSYNPSDMRDVKGTVPKHNNIIDITIKTGSAPSTPEPEPETAPNVPTNLVAEAQSSTSISLTWDEVDGAESYNIYYADSILVASTENNAYTITELTPATNYCYTVTALNAIGESGSSDKVCAETPAEGSSSFEGVVTIGGAVNSSNTSGNLPTNVNYNYTFSQQIYTKDEINVKAGTIGKIAFKQKGNQPNNPTRNLKVYMQNVQKTSFAKTSDWVSVTDSDKVFEGNVNLMGPGEDFVIELSKPFAYTGEGLLISVYDCTGNYTAAVAFYTYTADSRSLYVRNDNNPYDPANMSTTGTFPTVNNIIDLTFVAGSAEPTPELPSAPTNLVATAQSSTSIALSWNAVDGATSYNVYRNSSVNAIATVTTGTSYTDTNLTPATEYVYTVKAVNANGESAASNEARATTQQAVPSAPQNLAATAQSSSSIALTWTAVNGATSYNVYRNSSVNPIATVTTGTSYTDTNLTPAMEYVYTVKAVNSAGESAASNEARATTEADNTGDDLNGEEQVIPIGTLNANSWDTHMPTDVYYEYSYSQQIYTQSEIGINSGTITKIAFKQLDDGIITERSFAVYMKNTPKSAFTSSTDWVNVTSADKVFDGQVDLLGADKYLEITLDSPFKYTGGNLLISVCDNTGSYLSEAYFYTYYSESGSIYTRRDGTPFDPTTMNGYISNKNSWNDIKNYIEITIMTAAATEVPSAPANLTATVQSASSIALSWNAVDGVRSYNIYRNGEKIAEGLITTSYTDEGLNPATEYVYTVKAVNSAGESDASNEARAITHPLPPDAPTGLVATAQSTTSIALLWNQVNDATSYNIYRNSTKITSVTTLSYVDNNLTPNTQYCYVVKAVNGVVESEASDEECAKTQTVAVDHNGMEQEISVGGTQYESLNLPFNTWYAYSYSQQIYTKAEIDPDGIAVGGKITKIAFKQSNNFTTTREIVVYMQNTNKTSFTGTKNWAAVTAVDKVFEGSVTLPGAGGSLEITLNSPIEYTGGNILISIYDKTNVLDNQANFYTYSTNAYRALQTQGISCNPETMSGSSISGVQYESNNSIDFTFVLPVNEYTGDGNWNDASDWEEGLPNSNSNVAVSGNVTINSDVVVRTITIENGGSVTLESGSLTVKDDFTNTDASAFLIEDGTQVFQKNDDVRATFNMNIKAPNDWYNDHTQGWQFIASPMKDATTASFVPAHGYDLFKYDGAQDTQWVNYKRHADTDFETKFYQGRAYLASYEKNSKVAFEGTLNHETNYTFSEFRAYDGGNHYANFYLLGNPFAFNMDWDNMSVSDMSEGFAVVNLDGAYEYAIEGEIKVGDGFLVRVTGPEPSMTYTSNMRSVRTEKNEFINLVASGKAGKDNVIINFADNGREGFAKLDNFNKEIAEIYVKEDNRRYGIMNYEKDVEEIELYFDAKRMGEYTINAVTEGEFESVTLVDLITGNETDLLASSYTFKSMTNESTARFKLRIERDKENENFVYQTGSDLVIDAEGLVQIVDVMGRIIYSGEQNGVNRVNISNMEKAAYMVRNVNNKEVKVQKIVLF